MGVAKRLILPMARALGRLGQERRPKPHQRGIRFRLGWAMSVALLPILLLSLSQTRADFQREREDQRAALQLAAENSAATAKARLDTAVVLLRALGPESLGVYCHARLNSLVDQIEGYDGLFRYGPTGEVICGSRSAPSEPSPLTAGNDAPATLQMPDPQSVRGEAWFERLRNGDALAVALAPYAASDPANAAAPSLIVAVRAQRPLGDFNGASAAIVPLDALQPEINGRALPPGAQAALTDASGRILTATDDGAFRLRNQQGLAGWVERASTNEDRLFEGVTKDGQRRVFAGSAMVGGDVYVLLSAPAPGLLSWARINPISTLLLPLSTWFIALLAVMLVSERVVVRWLSYLERIAAIYARGRFSVRPLQAVRNAPSEIQVLARSMDEMGSAIAVRDRSLQDSLHEKDVLMREIHHRVKNNLQIISSLLSLQQRTLSDPGAKAALSDTRQRISALALIYRTLYQSADIRRADAREFLNDLVGQLVASEAGRGPLVTSKVTADSLIIDPDRLAPLALWLVEAVTNAQKHAFAERGGDLVVRFIVDGDQSVLEVEDDGPGPNVTDKTSGAAGLGRTLMTAFARQLQGETEVLAAPAGGVLARLTFATPEAPVPTPPASLS